MNKKKHIFPIWILMQKLLHHHGETEQDNNEETGRIKGLWHRQSAQVN